MTGTRQGRRVAIIGIMLGLMLGGAGSAKELVLPGEVFFYHPVASVFDQTAVWTNPAAIGTQPSGSMLLFTQRENRAVRDWGTSLTARMLGSAYRKIVHASDADYKEYTFAFGAGGSTRVGMSYQYITSGPGHLKHRHLWNAALLVRRTENLSVGARVENLNRGRIDGERSDIRFVYGIAARAYRDIVTISFDVDMTHKEDFSRADFHTGVEVRPSPGIFLFADFDNHSRFNLGFRLNFGFSYAGHNHNFDRRWKSYLSTIYVGSIKGKQASAFPSSGKTLTLRLDGDLPENPQLPFWGKKPLRYFDYVDGVYRAAEDKEIKSLFLDIGSLRCGLGKVEELREAVSYFRSKGKNVRAHLADPNNLGYLLACAADTVSIPPVSQLNLIGLRATLESVKGLLDKIGVEAEIERVDEYKTAPEWLVFDQPTEPNREQINRLLDRLYAYMVDAVADSRGITPDSVKVLIDLAPHTSVEAQACGLVDILQYHDEAQKGRSGPRAPLRCRRVDLEAYLRHPIYVDRWGKPPLLAVVVADGEINAGKSGGKVGEYEMLSAIRRVREDARVKGVLLRVNSPGGSALASDLVWHEIEQTVRKKPLVISMGNVAASGGYYISCVPSDIFINRCSLTGSIGVYGGKVNIAELLDKIGVYAETYSRGRNADIYSLYEPYTEEQRAQLRRQLREFYRHFTELVAAARSLTADSVDGLGRGQVWTGDEAIAGGLADRIGGFHAALEALGEYCGIDPRTAIVESYPRKRYFIKNPFSLPEIAQKAAAWLVPSADVVASTVFNSTDHIYFRMPYNIVVE